MECPEDMECISGRVDSKDIDKRMPMVFHLIFLFSYIYSYTYQDQLNFRAFFSFLKFANA